MHMDALMAQSIWFCWNYETRKGKKTKVPKSAAGKATGTNDTYRHIWVIFDAAQKAAQERGYDGVGFRIPEDYFFLDIDHMNETDTFVQGILDCFDSYTERSVSGEGLHIYGRCDVSRLPTCMDKDGKLRLDKDYYTKKPSNNIELYSGALTNRFAVYTGNAVRDVPLKDCTDALLATLDQNMRRRPKEESPVTYVGVDGETYDDHELFEVVTSLMKQKNGDKFSQLFHAGDCSEYGSQSETDCALCSMIAFRVGPNPDAIDKVFRASALYREKWKRQDYRKSTIATGVEACRGTFHRAVRERPYFIRYDEQSGKEYVVVLLLAKYVREHLRYVLVRDNGKQGLLKYVYEDGCYRLYSNDMLMGVIKQYIADYDEELVRMSKVSEALQHISTDLNYISQDELDANEHLINFRNGLLHPENADIIEETYAAIEQDLANQISGIRSQILMNEDKQNTVSKTRRIARSVIEVYDNFLESETINKESLHLLIDKILVSEDQLEIKFKPDITALLQHGEQFFPPEDLSAEIVQESKNHTSRPIKVRISSEPRGNSDFAVTCGEPLLILTVAALDLAIMPRRMSRMSFSSASVCWLGWLCGRLDWQARDATLPSQRCFQK